MDGKIGGQVAANSWSLPHWLGGFAKGGSPPLFGGTSALVAVTLYWSKTYVAK
jgi:hypothetical protein